MYKIKLKDMTENEVNESIRNFFQEEPASEYIVIFKLNQLLIDRDISQKELSIRTGIREATLTSYRKGTIKSISIPIMLRIMIELNLKEINDLIEIKPQKEYHQLEKITYNYQLPNYENIYNSWKEIVAQQEQEYKETLKSKLERMIEEYSDENRLLASELLAKNYNIK